MQVAEVILPLPLDKLFHYAIPAEMVGSVRPGMRILVQFGARKEYAAIVTRVLEAPDETELKYLISVLDEYPVVLEHQLLQWSWMASYYMAPVGDVMNAALPPGLKLSSQSVVVLDPEVVPDESSMSDALFKLYEALRNHPKLTLDEVREFCQVKQPMPLVQKALEEGWALLEEELKKVVKQWVTNKEVTKKKYGHISLWDTSKINDMSYLFENYNVIYCFNTEISDSNCKM